MAKKINALHKQIVDSTATGGHAFVEPTIAAQLRNEGLVLVNENLHDDEGSVAVKATEKLSSQINGTSSPASPAQPVSKPTFEVSYDIPVPPRSPRGVGATVYPFETMNVGGSFFVPASAKMPNPVKSLTGTVSSATRRYASISETEMRKNRNGQMVPKSVPTRRFQVFPADGGARVFRVA